MPGPTVTGFPERVARIQIEADNRLTAKSLPLRVDFAFRDNEPGVPLARICAPKAEAALGGPSLDEAGLRGYAIVVWAAQMRPIGQGRGNQTEVENESQGRRRVLS